MVDTRQVVGLVVSQKIKPPSEAIFTSILYLKLVFQLTWSAIRDSNSRRPAWKVGTLPTELLPL